GAPHPRPAGGAVGADVAAAGDSLRLLQTELARGAVPAGRTDPGAGEATGPRPGRGREPGVRRRRPGPGGTGGGGAPPAGRRGGGAGVRAPCGGAGGGGALWGAGGAALSLPMDAVSGRYTMPAVWGLDLMTAALLGALAAVPLAWPKRLAWTALTAGLATVAVASVGRQEKFAARADLLWQALEHV